jgi:RsiW-degrading membrane proteinase PrsW (M82 family)
MNDKQKDTFQLALYITLGIIACLIIICFFSHRLEFKNIPFYKDLIDHKTILPVAYQLFGEHGKLICNFNYLMILGALFLLYKKEDNNSVTDIVFLISSTAVIVSATLSINYSLDYLYLLGANLIEEKEVSAISENYDDVMKAFLISICLSFINLLAFSLSKKKNKSYN